MVIFRVGKYDEGRNFWRKQNDLTLQLGVNTNSIGIRRSQWNSPYDILKFCLKYSKIFHVLYNLPVELITDIVVCVFIFVILSYYKLIYLLVRNWNMNGIMMLFPLILLKGSVAFVQISCIHRKYLFWDLWPRITAYDSMYLLEIIISEQLANQNGVTWCEI